MDDPETPVIDDREVAVRAIEQGGNVEERNGHGSVEKERREVRFALFHDGRAKSPEHEEEPEDQSSRKKNLPETPQIKILGTLVTQPEPQRSELVVDAEKLTAQTAEYHHEERNEEQVDAEPLPFRLMSSNPWGEEKTPRNPCCSYPEYNQLEVEGSQEIVGE